MIGQWQEHYQQTNYLIYGEDDTVNAVSDNNTLNISQDLGNQNDWVSWSFTVDSVEVVKFTFIQTRMERI
jgi:hypothetical protein